MDIQNILTQLNKHQADPSITITTDAANTYKDAALVREHLKISLRKAEVLLHHHYDKHTVKRVMDRCHELVSQVRTVDSRPGMALFVNEEIGELVHLPFHVHERVTVGSTFFTRELLRAGLGSISYHILILGSQQARLLHAHDDHLLAEIRDSFPVHNEHHSMDALEASNARVQDELMRNYFLEVHDAVLNVVGSKGKVVIACVSSLHGHFMKAIGPAPIYIAHLKGAFSHIPDRELVDKAWELVHGEQKRRDLAELWSVAETAPRVSNLVDEIWTQVHQGRGHILYVERDKQQAGVIKNEHATLLHEQMDHIPGIDLVDAIIEEQINHGGEIRIVPNGALERFGGIALKPRY